MLDWLKVKTDILNDPKLRRYFTKAERWDWISLLCLAGRSKEAGVILLPDDEIAYAIEIDDNDWPAFEQKLTERRMVYRRDDDNALVIVNWDSHQYTKPSNLPEAVRERVAKSRENKRATAATKDIPASVESADVTPRNAPVTPCNTTEQKSREQNRTEKNSSSRGEESPRGEPGALPGADDSAAAADSHASHSEGEGDPALDPVAGELISHGVNRADAVRLAKAKPNECRRQLAFLPFVRDFKSGKGAFLRTAIEHGYGPPKGWTEREERLEKERQRTRADTQSREAEERQRIDREGEQVAYRVVLAEAQQDPEGWAALLARAEEMLPPPIRKNRDGPGFQPALDAKIRELVCVGSANLQAGGAGNIPRGIISEIGTEMSARTSVS